MSSEESTEESDRVYSSQQTDETDSKETDGADSTETDGKVSAEGTTGMDSSQETNVIDSNEETDGIDSAFGSDAEDKVPSDYDVDKDPHVIPTPESQFANLNVDMLRSLLKEGGITAYVLYAQDGHMEMDRGDGALTSPTPQELRIMIMLLCNAELIPNRTISVGGETYNFTQVNAVHQQGIMMGQKGSRGIGIIRTHVAVVFVSYISGNHEHKMALLENVKEFIIRAGC